MLRLVFFVLILIPFEMGCLHETIMSYFPKKGNMKIWLNMWASYMSLYVRKKGMTFALEPKIVFPGEGSVGVENTVAVTEKGYEILTPASTNIFQV